MLTILADESCTAEEEEKYHNIGTIQVEVWRCHGEVAKPEECDEDYDTVGSVPEKLVKGAALDIYTKLDSSIIMGKYQIESWESTKIEEEPCAVFIFKYRSKGALQALGILARPSSPQPLEERDVETLTSDELKELARRFKALQEAQKVKVKQEKLEANLAQLAELKRVRQDGDDKDDEVEFLSQQPVKKVCSVGGIID
ncbi:hypothetical protein A1O7_05769 [Cladophialophora yegresii CBS 114405]|uniref:DUF7918 domain-containing protein n=1 Tax=Cladophialophora yegresii CBS 114405 TaxID=1182544 RepID=W9WIP0_9EURO|nr:uncharacterized protein A1O7_05769 [Cladophialophora yegresii CBS 114405]EXJ58344.1 hypothetical protein A1O7_05769 [Cladophialophora yegresii CBS 114405]